MKQIQFAGMTFSSVEKMRDFIRSNKRNYGCEKHLNLTNKPIWLVENGRKVKVAIYDSPEAEGISYKSEYKKLSEEQ